MKKGVSEVISVVMIVTISLALISTILLYAYPMIRKNQDRVSLEKVMAFFAPEASGSFIKKLEYISNFGGAEGINLDVDGIWEIRSYKDNSPFNNSISFSFFSRTTNVRSNQLISLTPGETCPPTNGIIGKDSPFVVCVSGSPVFDGFNITYIVFARNLTSDTQVLTTQIYSTQNIVRSNLKKIRVSREGFYTTQEGGKIIQIVKLKIEV